MFTVDDRAVGPHSKDSDAADHERLVLEARNVEFDWADLPFHYVPDEPMATHVLNVLHLLLPAGEEFFVEVFKKTLPLIKDDQLRLDIQGFIGQEAMHSQAHSGVLAHFDAQGIDLTPFTNQIRWLFEKLLGDRPHRSERRQHSWLLEQVSFISAIEHYTAVLGEWILDSPGARRRRHRPGDAGHAAVAWGRRSRAQGGRVRHHEASAGRVLAAGARPAGGDAGDVAVVDSRSAVHVLGGPVRAAGHQSRAGGTTSGRRGAAWCPGRCD